MEARRKEGHANRCPMNHSQKRKKNQNNSKVVIGYPRKVPLTTSDELKLEIQDEEEVTMINTI